VSKGRRGLTEEERKLWRRVAAHVKPRQPHADEKDPGPSSIPTPTPNRIKRPFAPAPPQATRVAAPPQDRGAERRVRRGQLAIDATLDLHGHSQETGRAALARFLRTAQERNARIVIVITGIGRAGRGVLRCRVPEWLAERDLRPLVAGFAQAHRAHGGEGAYYVFLRRDRAA